MATPTRVRQLIGGVWRYVTAQENGGGGSQPVGGLLSKELLFTEVADEVGVYEATFDMEAGSAVFDVIAYALGAPWVNGESIDDTEATLDVFDADGAYLYQQPLVAGPLGTIFNPAPPFEAGGDKGGPGLDEPPKGWVAANLIQGWSQPTGGTGDYPFILYGYVYDATEAPWPGPMRRYTTAATITARITTTLATASPLGVLLVKILYFAEQTPEAAVFEAAP